MSETVLLENRGAVAIMTLNRPESMNAMNPQMLDTMFRVARQAADDPAIRCLVITGNGRAFSAGGDVKAMASGNADGTRITLRQKRFAGAARPVQVEADPAVR